MFLSSFAYSKSLNDQPEICGSSPWPQNSYNVAADRGPSEFDEKFRWVSSFDYQLPIGNRHRLVGSSRVRDLLAGGWRLGGIFTISSRFYFSPLMGYDPSNTGSIGLVQTDRTCNGNLPSGRRSPNLWVDMSCFPLPSGYAFGDSGKNVLIGPGGVSTDFALRKVFDITERQNFEFRAEFFNTFNHPVFAQPDNYITDRPGAAGVITSTVLPQREIQFGLKLHF